MFTQWTWSWPSNVDVKLTCSHLNMCFPRDLGRFRQNRWTSKQPEYIYIYICCKLKAGPRFVVFVLKTGPRVVLKTGPSFFTVFPYKKTQIVSHCAKIVFFANCRDVRNEVFEKKIAFFVFVFFLMLETEKQKKNKKWKRPPNPIKIGILRWSSKNGKSEKCFCCELPYTICVKKGEKRAFSCTLSVLAKIFLAQNSAHQEKL